MTKTIAEFKQDGTIGIIGGSGKMGNWALNLFHSLGYSNLLFNDLPNPKTPEEIFNEKVSEIKEKTGARFVSKKELAELSDLVIVSVPISATLGIIDEIGPSVRQDAIFSDFTSVKEASCERMSRYSPHAIGIHPMFKETVKKLKGQNIVLTPYNQEDPNLSLLVKMFNETGANVRIVTPQQHDQIVSFNQAGVHLVTMAYALMMKAYCREHNLEPTDIAALNTPNSTIMNALLGRFLHTRNYEIIWGIQNTTSYSQNMKNILLEQTKALTSLLGISREECERISHNLEHLVELPPKEKRNQFQASLEAAARKFKSGYLRVASADSDQIVDLMGNLGVQAYYDTHYKETLGLLHEIKERCCTVGLFERSTSETMIASPQSESHQIGKILTGASDLYFGIETNLETESLRKARDYAIELRRYISKIIIPRRKDIPELGNHSSHYRVMNNQLKEFIGKCEELAEVQSLLPKIPSQ